MTALLISASFGAIISIYLIKVETIAEDLDSSADVEPSSGSVFRRSLRAPIRAANGNVRDYLETGALPVWDNFDLHDWGGM